MTKAPHAPSGEAGFTLLEMLIAMALLGLLSLVLFASARFGIETWSRSERAMANADHARNAEALLSNALTRAYPMLLASGSSDAHIDFDGAADSVTFLSPDSGLPGAMTRSTIKAEETADGTALVDSATLELAARIETRQTVLLKHVKALTVSYFGAEADAPRPTWHRTWHDKTKLPSLIRFQIALVGGPQDAWPDFVVAPRLSADIGCSFDPLTKNCRGL